MLTRRGCEIKKKICLQTSGVLKIVFIYGNSRKINWLENNHRQNDDLGEWGKHLKKY